MQGAAVSSALPSELRGLRTAAASNGVAVAAALAARALAAGAISHPVNAADEPFAAATVAWPAAARALAASLAARLVPSTM